MPLAGHYQLNIIGINGVGDDSSYTLESLYIEKQDQGTTMNNKNENGRGGLVCLTATENT